MTLAAPFETLFQRHPDASQSQASIAVSCYKYGREAVEALDSVLLQTEPVLDLVVVDDHSPDDSAVVMQQWLETNAGNDKLGRVSLVRHIENQGLSQSRNTALSLVETPYVFVLDADNQIYPRAIEQLRLALENSGCAMAYSLIEQFGDSAALINNSLWSPERFCHGNYIDAMTLLRVDVVRELGGYRKMMKNFGWEDYDLWCSLVDRGLKGCHVPQILCRYRVHKASMIRTVTNRFVSEDVSRVRDDFAAHHKMEFKF